MRCVRRTRGGVTHRDSSEAAAWIASERSDWPFAFVNVCDFLGLDAEIVRARLDRRVAVKSNRFGEEPRIPLDHSKVRSGQTA